MIYFIATNYFILRLDNLSSKCSDFLEDGSRDLNKTITKFEDNIEAILKALNIKNQVY